MDKTTQGLKTLAEYMGENPNSGHIYKYNTSWDALVPVFVKWYNEADDIPNEGIGYWRDYEEAHNTDNKQAAFEAVVELVELINKEK